MKSDVDEVKVEPPEGWVYVGCPECGNVALVPAAELANEPFCSHTIRGRFHWRVPGMASAWTAMVPVEVTPRAPEEVVASGAETKTVLPNKDSWLEGFMVACWREGIDGEELSRGAEEAWSMAFGESPGTPLVTDANLCTDCRINNSPAVPPEGAAPSLGPAVPPEGVS